MSSVELSTTLHPTTGFHTTLSSRLQVNQTGHPPECSLYILHTFSPHLIVDPYELIDRHLPFEFFGASNLELPAWAVDQNSTYLLLKLAASVHTLSLMSEVSFDVPLHVRYGTPILGGSSHVVEVTAPTCFWACPSTCTPVDPMPFVQVLTRSKSIHSPKPSLTYPALYIPLFSHHLDSQPLGSLES
ncbi:hypothetical protein BV22DRAFT_1041714 [Leucogyrophana mollusca]|uniref:Uncharacterized protein n=1 Tax=Leucogyrophana mollusca TaxID=85980 RepID=A0ACB8AYM7_9AGAM|nr:hypothetical protein BV22DRAFT_1041714 [Leucogyrophana mollusca]